MSNSKRKQKSGGLSDKPFRLLHRIKTIFKQQNKFSLKSCGRGMKFSTYLYVKNIAGSKNTTEI